MLDSTEFEGRILNPVTPGHISGIIVVTLDIIDRKKGTFKERGMWRHQRTAGLSVPTTKNSGNCSLMKAPRTLY